LEILMRVLSTTVCLAAIAAVAAPAFAQSRSEVRSEVVYYADLDTYSDAGADALIDRIEAAAANVCGDRSGPMSINEDDFIDTCSQVATEDAVRDVGNSIVTARFYGVTPQIEIDTGANDNPSPAVGTSVEVKAVKPA